MLFKSVLIVIFCSLNLVAFSSLSLANEGTEKWNYSTNGAIFGELAVAEDGTIYIGNWQNNNVFALNEDGSLKWQFEMDSSIQYGLALDTNGTVYASAGNDLTAINADGSENWTYTQESANFSSPAVAPDGTIYVGASDDNLYAINPDGTFLWSFDVSGGINGAPAIAGDGTVFVGSQDGNLYAINANGTLNWSFESSGPIVAPPSIGEDGTIYINSTDKKLYAISSLGIKKWHLSLPDSVAGTVAIANDGTLYMGSNDSNLYSVNRNGTINWSFAANNIITSSPAIASDGAIYFGSLDQNLYSLDPDGSLNWSFSSGSGFGSPSIAEDGTIYVANRIGQVYAINGNAGLMNSPWPKYAQNNRNSGTVFHDLNDPNSNFSLADLTNKTFVAHPLLRENWLPNSSLVTFSFENEQSAKSSDASFTGIVETIDYDWQLKNGRVKASSEEFESTQLFIGDSFVEVFGNETSLELQSLFTQGQLSSFEIPVSQQTVLTWKLVERLGNKVKVNVIVENRFELILPPDIEFQSNTMGGTNELQTFEMFDVQAVQEQFIESQIPGQWAMYLPMTLPDYINSSGSTNGIFVDIITFEESGLATGQLGGTDYNWSLNSGSLSLTSGNSRIEFVIILNRGSQYLVHTKTYIDDVFVEEYSKLISKVDGSAMDFVDDLVTDLPIVINSDLFADLASSWNDGQRKFDGACCFAYQFLADGRVLPNLFSDTFEDPENPKFIFPERYSTYNVVGTEITIQRVLNSDDIFNRRIWTPLSVDEFGSTYVVEWSVRFDSNREEINDQIGAGYFVKPRINIFNKVDLSIYEEEYANSTLPQPDFDNDGIPDATDPDDDNDGALDGDDAFPLNFAASVDSDGDGKPDDFNPSCDQTCISLSGLELDDDDDNDGVLDVDDAYPLDPTRTRDDSAVVSKDVNGDGMADILWRNQSDGRNWMWTMDGRSILTSAGINTIADPAWQIVGRGDFDGDGKSDILWRNSETGRNWVYLMDGFNIASSQQLNYVYDNNWHVKGVGDFDGDGKDDVIWRHAVRGDTWVYLMNGTQIRVSQGSRKVSDLNWKIVAVGDVDGDSQDDVIWRHATRGDNYIWLMNGVQLSSGYVLNRISTNWEITGAGDLNGDGTDDILWRNKVDGRNWGYLMNGGQIKTSQLINTVSSQDWQMADILDLDGDGKVDIFWRNNNDGRSYIFLMNGLSITSQGFSTSVSNNWQVKN